MIRLKVIKCVFLILYHDKYMRVFLKKKKQNAINKTSKKLNRFLLKPYLIDIL